jgi:hypothetical protein
VTLRQKRLFQFFHSQCVLVVSGKGAVILMCVSGVRKVSCHVNMC